MVVSLKLATLVELLTATCALAATRFFFRIIQRTRRLRSLPGPPPPQFYVGNLVDLQLAKVGTRYNVWTSIYGRAYRIHGLLSEAILVLSDPKGINHVLSANSPNYTRDEVSRNALEIMFGKSLFSVEGEEHRRMRKSLAGVFTPQSVQEISPTLFDLAYRLKDTWEEKILQTGSSGTVFSICSSLHILTLDAISMTTFGHNCSASSGEIPALLDKISNAPRRGAAFMIAKIVVSFCPFIVRLPSPMKHWARRLKTELGRVAEEVWSGGAKGEAAGMHSKVLDLIDKSNSDDGEAISREEAIAQIIGILFAGSESTANVISECLYELARNPDMQKKLRAELLDFEQTNGRAPGYDDLMSATALPYLDAVLRELNRTKPVLMAITRAAAQDDVIPLEYPIAGTDGVRAVHVKAGQTVYIPVRDGVNVDPLIWGADGAAFRPERWLDAGALPDDVQKVRAQGHVLTFGDGPKACLGRLFAIAEMKIVISVLIRHFIFEDEGRTLDFYHLGGNTVKPKIRGSEEEGVQLPLRVSIV
ncbi:cytochrome P450 [Phellopilus nigrolimitatus]|nr:cytochrome P450 [Phellopilus nigrolimitatus]